MESLKKIVPSVNDPDAAFNATSQVSNPTWGACQGVWNRREIQLTRTALPCDFTCFADGTSFVLEIFV